MPNSTAESTEGPLNTSVQQDNGITTDNSHSYFLHQSDAPGMVLVNTPFDGKGYPEWRRSILISLSTKNKLGFIDEACPAPNLADPTFKLWSHCNDMVFPADFKFIKSKKFQGTMRSNSATSMEEPDGNQSILDAFENHNVAQKLSPNQFTQLVHLLKHIQEGKPVGSEVNVNLATGPFLEEPSSFW
ncbi:hypothetical protein KY285_001126 [Solanum tuberosum]|nr:hypothetical protein KY285_001126 [Solanum tuberosum]